LLLPQLVKEDVISHGTPMADLPRSASTGDQIEERKAGFVIDDKNVVTTRQNVGIVSAAIIV
jgi:hypothetical protein